MANLEKVIKVLQENGANDEEAKNFVIKLNNLLSQKLYVELITTINDEKDRERLDKMSENEAHEQMQKLYKEKTGKEFKTVSDEILDGFVTGFLTEYHKQKLAEKKA